MSDALNFDFSAYVVGAAFLGDTPIVALGDGSVRRVLDGDTVATPMHEGAILAAIPSRDGTTLITGGDDGLLATVNANGEVSRKASRPNKWVDQLAAGPKGEIAFGYGRQVEVLLPDGKERTLDLPRAVGGLAFAPKGLRLAIARYDGVSLWMPGTEAAPSALEWDGAHIAATFSPDGKYLVSAMQDNQLHGWRLSDGKDMRMSGYPAKPRSLSWSVKGRHLATSGANAAVLWPFHVKDGPQGREPLQLGPRDVVVTRVACHPRDESVAIGYLDGLLALVGFDGSELLIRQPGDGPVTALAWSADGKRLIFGTEGGAAGLTSPAKVA